MNTAIAITAIIAVFILGCVLVTAIRDVAQTKHQTRAGAANVRALHRKATHGDDCVHCGAFAPGYDNTWPCQTIRALDGDPTSKENSA